MDHFVEFSLQQTKNKWWYDMKKRNRLALLSNNNKTGCQCWYKPSKGANHQKVISLLENGQTYFRDHFIEETMDLTVKEFTEIIGAFDFLNKTRIK